MLPSPIVSLHNPENLSSPYAIGYRSVMVDTIPSLPGFVYIWLFILLRFIIWLAMVGVYRALWVALLTGAIGTLVYALSFDIKFVGMVIGLLLIATCPFAQDVYLSKIQSLRNEIDYKERGAKIAFDERQKLEELMETNAFQWLIKRFRKR